MEPKEFYILADKLVKKSQSGAANLRTAISRAYYAAFHCGKVLLKGNMGFNKISDGPAGHGDVWKYLQSSGDDQVVHCAQQLVNLRTSRNHADYDLNRQDVENQKTAEAKVIEAGKIIKILDSCYSEPKRSQIRNSIQKWRSKFNYNI